MDTRAALNLQIESLTPYSTGTGGGSHFSVSRHKKVREHHDEHDFSGLPVIDVFNGPALNMQNKIGELQFTSGYPTDKAVQKIYDELDFQRAVSRMDGLCPWGVHVGFLTLSCRTDKRNGLGLEIPEWELRAGGARAFASWQLLLL